MRFMIFVIDTNSNSGSTAELRSIDQFNAELEGKGSLVMAAGIAGSSMGTLVDNREGRNEVHDGSLNGEEFYSGFWIIEASTESLAKQIASDASKACNRKVELRPFL